MKLKYGVYGGKGFGGKYPRVNKYFKKKKEASKFVMRYSESHPRRKLTLIKI